jgi:3-hydroxyacyl-CoA dehydrogenase
MSQRKIRKVAVLGSGVMGSRIACHFANIGVQVFASRYCPKEVTEDEKAKGWTTDHPSVKNRIVNQSLQAALKSNPSPVFNKSVAALITTGNFTDNMKDIRVMRLGA